MSLCSWTKGSGVTKPLKKEVWQTRTSDNFVQTEAQNKHISVG